MLTSPAELRPSSRLSEYATNGLTAATPATPQRHTPSTRLNAACSTSDRLCSSCRGSATGMFGDRTLELMRRGYLWAPRLRAGAAAVSTRVLGRPAVVVAGP